MFIPFEEDMFITSNLEAASKGPVDRVASAY